MSRHGILARATAGLLLGFGAAVAAQAQDAGSRDTERPAERFFQEQRASEIRAGELIGLEVASADGDTLGRVRDVVIVDGLGIKAIVLGVGGLFGIGEKQVAVNYAQLDRSRTEDGAPRLTLRLGSDEVAAAPEFLTFEAQRRAEQEAARQEDVEAQRREQMERSPGSESGTGTETPGTR